jgi:hypothetical protein
MSNHVTFECFNPVKDNFNEFRKYREKIVCTLIICPDDRAVMDSVMAYHRQLPSNYVKSLCVVGMVQKKKKSGVNYLPGIATRPDH